MPLDNKYCPANVNIACKLCQPLLQTRTIRNIEFMGVFFVRHL